MLDRRLTRSLVNCFVTVPELSQVEGGQTSSCDGVVRRKSCTRQAKLKVVQFFEANGRNLYQTCKRFSLNNRTVKQWITMNESLLQSRK